MASTTDRNTPRRSGTGFRIPLAAGVRIFTGRMVGVDKDGNAVSAGQSSAVAVVGISQERADNRHGLAGEVSIEVRRGTFLLKAAAGGLTRASYGKHVKAVDDETVALAGTDPAVVVAGTLRDVDADGVWVEF